MGSKIFLSIVMTLFFFSAKASDTTAYRFTVKHKILFLHKFWYRKETVYLVDHTRWLNKHKKRLKRHERIILY